MKTVMLKLVCAIGIAGEVVPRDSLIEVTESEAKDLLRRGKAVVHTEAPADADRVVSSGTVDSDLHPAIAAHQDDRAEQAAEQAAGGDAQVDDKPTGKRRGK